jgi:hypothetical protein
MQELGTEGYQGRRGSCEWSACSALVRCVGSVLCGLARVWKVGPELNFFCGAFISSTYSDLAGPLDLNHLFELPLLPE